ncbi:MAG: diguanylate cyclase [Lachnospiraceae bacterium]|nr:diguanylate cyclase [Lachnospiraceae bacterium]
MRFISRRKFTRKLILSISALSIAGLLVMFVIVNTVVRNIIHENITGAVYNDMRATSKEIDAWFNVGNHVVNSLARVWPVMGTNNIKPIAVSLLNEYDFIVEIYAGFADGSYLGSENWEPDGFWDSTTRGWYREAAASRGESITTIPYESATMNINTITTVATVAKWIPDLGGMEAVVAVDIAISSIIEKINHYRLAGGGYFILFCPNGEIISHPNIRYTLSPEGIINIKNIPNGDLLMDSAITEGNSYKFDDRRLGASYLMKFSLESTGWTLAAVVPAAAISESVSRNLWVIILAFAAILISLFALTMIFMSLLTKNMEEGRVVAQRMQSMLDSSPLLCTIFDENSNVIEANQEAVRLFEIPDKQLYIDNYFAFSPELQPDGISSRDKALAMLKVACEEGHSRFEWTYMNSKGELIPCEEIIMDVKSPGGDTLIAYTRDLREFYKFKETEKAAYTDALTGARNRRFLMTTAEKDLQVCIEEDLQFSLIMMDIDFFKKVNDTYGHPVGDEVLKIVVSRIRHVLKKDTLVARYGGEEFVITFPDINYKDVFETAERIRSHIAKSAFSVGDLKIPVTISLGAARRSEQYSSLADIINNADKALYQAKQTGRNKVVSFEEITM